MKKMPVSYIIEMLRETGASWDQEQQARLSWIENNYPDYYKIVKSGDIDGSMLYLASSNLNDGALKDPCRAGIWINGHRAGIARYKQGKEYSKITVEFYPDLKWAERMFLSAYNQFKSNFGKITWVKHV